jgi:hypothetical protein
VEGALRSPFEEAMLALNDYVMTAEEQRRSLAVAGA